MHQDYTINLYSQLLKKLGSKWPKFVESLKDAADKDD
jgi:hypothetical protein